MATLFVFSRLPGAGKTTLSRRLAARLGGVHLCVDTIEQAGNTEEASLHHLFDALTARRTSNDGVTEND